MSEPVLTPEMHAAGNEVTATEKELIAAIMSFDAETIRNDSRRLVLATEAAHAALQHHLDAKASLMSIVKRGVENR